MLTVVRYGVRIIILKVKELRLDLAYLCIIRDFKYSNITYNLKTIIMRTAYFSQPALISFLVQGSSSKYRLPMSYPNSFFLNRSCEIIPSHTPCYILARNSLKA